MRADTTAGQTWGVSSMRSGKVGLRWMSVLRLGALGSRRMMIRFAVVEPIGIVLDLICG